jgi:hypothetical protein
LPYSHIPKRRVIYQRSNEKDPVVVKPRNVIVQWEAPRVIIRKDYKFLGVIRANPLEYVQRFGPTLKAARDLPSFVLDIKPPEGIILAADYHYNQVHELEGDLEALKLINLDQEGLSEYKSQVDKLTSSSVKFSSIVSSQQQQPPQTSQELRQPSLVTTNLTTTTTAATSLSKYDPQIHTVNTVKISSAINNSTSVGTYSTSSIKSYNSNILDIVSEILSQADRNHTGRLSLEEAEKLLLKLNSRLGRRYTEEDMKKFFLTVNNQKDGTISLEEFRVAFERIL